MRRIATIILSLFCGVCGVGSSFSWAQDITSAIVGHVMDTTGAVIPDVGITITNSGTGVSLTATTDSGGAYTVPNLLAGTYVVSASKQGFETYKVTGIELLAMATARVDVTLKVGAVSQTVSVAGKAPLVTTDSSIIGSTLTTEQITELPFIYQSIGNVLGLVAGGQVPAGQADHNYTGGARNEGGTNWTLNGAMVNNANIGGGGYTFEGNSLEFENLPGLSSMQEFQEVSNNVTAEYRATNSVIMVTKQGTNQFHGELYDDLQNTVLDANTLQLNAAGSPRAKSLSNQFGANVGGPIVRDKAWFFFDFEGLRRRTYGVNSSTFPSIAMRGGNFAALCTTFTSGICTTGTQLYNPFTGQPFTNNLIPTGMFASQATALLPFLPATDLTTNPGGLPSGGIDYTGTVSAAEDMDQYNTRADYQLSHTDSISGFYAHSTPHPWNQFLGYPSTYGNATDYGGRDQSVSVSETHTFNPATLNVLRVAWFRLLSRRWGQNLNFNPATLFPQLTPGENRGLPTTTMTGYTDMFHDSGIATAGTRDVDVEITENFVRVQGRHTIKAGIDETGIKHFVPGVSGSLGTFSFSGVWTGNKGWPGQPQSQGNAFADFLLGVANTSSDSTVPYSFPVYDRDWEPYVQDTWQATHRLTLSFGLRYAYQTPWTELENQTVFFDQTNNKLALPENSATVTLPPYGASAALLAAYPFETTQSIGLPTHFLESGPTNFGPRFGFAFRPFSDTSTVIRGGYGIYYDWRRINVTDESGPPYAGTTLSYTSSLPGNPTAPYMPDLTFSNPFPTGLVSGTAPSAHPAVSGVQRNFADAEVQQWNLTLEHQFGTNLMGRVSYLGSRGDHLPWDQQNISTPETQTPNATTQAQLLFQPWASVSMLLSGGIQNYNSLQVEVIRRFSTGMAFQAEYQYTRCLTTAPVSGGVQVWQQSNLDYGPCDYQLDQNLVFNYIWHLPVGRGQYFLNNIGKAANAVLGGWEVSGVTTYQTGAPFSVGFTVPSSYIGWMGGRADVVSGANPYVRGSGHNVISGVQWFNPAAFTAPPPWTWGNGQRDVLFGPGFWDWDISALKNFAMPWSEHHQLQLRADFLDAFNHSNLNAPAATISASQYGGLPIPTAGVIHGATGNRVVQFGLKYSF